MANMEYFPAFFGYLDSLAMLDDAQFGRVFRAALLYARDGIEPDLEPLEAMAFAFIRGDIERAKAKYEAIAERNRINGMKGGRPKNPENPVGYLGTQKNPEEPKKPIQDNTKQNNTTQYNTSTPAEAEEKPDPVPYSKISELFNKLCPSYSAIRGITGKRKVAVAARWKENPDLEVFETLFEKAEASDFMKGQNNKNWRADFDWMMVAGNWNKILEGRYDNRQTPEEQPKGSFDTDDYFSTALRRSYGGNQ